ncbi:hypothetical protein [Fibrella forsythiae]|uniref:Uncharacterized protein n=1 Tax=Fibrella forsythiae TaxID=2817061 RepID=A0ABS3JRJ4_9BACT|nr:hypothetical protein [Fibrella forsythiae]MBO0952638.1 hypothetical protein [Fibrella forsythiae]
MHNYTITEFPDDGEYWLLSWVGPVGIYESDHRIEVDLVAIDYERYEKDPTIISYIKKTDQNFVKRKTIKSIGIECLVVINVGSVWRNKKLVSTPLRNSKFNDLTVKLRQAEMSTIKPVNSIVELPYKYHPFSGEHCNSDCLVIDSPFFTVESGNHKITKILIPPSELMKFYYCGSSYVIKHLIGTGIQDDQLFTKADTRINDETKEAYINMRKGTVDNDCLILGRIAVCSVALQNATDIGRQIRYAFYSKKKPYLNAKFPFNGATTLSVKGKVICLKEGIDNPEYGFLVYAILLCTAPFPFEKLFFDRDNNNQQTEDALEEKKASPSALKKPADPTPNASISSTESADSHFSNVLTPIPIDDRFGHVPPAERVQKDQQKVRTIGRVPIYTIDTETYTTSGLPSDTTGIAPTTLTTEDNQDLGNTDYTALQRIVSCLRWFNLYCLYYNWYEWKYSPSFIDFPFPAYLGTNQSVKNWRLINSVRGKSKVPLKVRRLTIVKIIHGGTGFYLVDCEARTSERFSRVLLHTPGRFNIDHLLMAKTISLLMDNKGIWSKCDLTSFNIIKQPFDHLKKDSPSAVAERLVRYINRF